MSVMQSKTIPIQAWTDRKGSRRLLDFKTMGARK